MKRYLPSRRTRSNINHSSAIGDQLIRQFTEQAQAVMEQLTAQFTENLQAQATQIVQNQVLPSILPASSIGSGAAGGDGGAGSIGAIGQLLGTAARYLVSRPRTSRNEVETTRSRDAARLSFSTSQAAAEAQQMLYKGDKNL